VIVAEASIQSAPNAAVAVPKAPRAAAAARDPA
jgi:hypothetical protein